MRPNNHPHQPPTTPSCLRHVHGLNNVQNALFRPMACFFQFFLILLVLTNVLRRQVDKMRPNDHLHQPPTTRSCLRQVHGLNNAQNAPFRPMVCFFILFISLLPTNVLPCQVDETQPDNDPHQPPPTPFSLCHDLGLNDAQNASFRPIIVFFCM